MALEGVMLIRISQAEKDKYYMIYTYFWNLKANGLPWWSVVRNLPSSNAGDVGSISGQGTEIPHSTIKTRLTDK